MKKILLTYILLIMAASVVAQPFGPDIYNTSRGKLSIYFIGHGTLMFGFNGKIIHVDPWSKLADYTKLPKADLIFITHQHGDHYDTAAIRQVTKENTLLILNAALYELLHTGEIMKNGDVKEFLDIKVTAVPAYNTSEGRDNFHPKGRDNGYVFDFGNLKVYVAGDTENIPEMKFLRGVDIAFLPMNQPYTMTPEQVALAVDMFEPKILYPYHYGETDLDELKKLMQTRPQTELKIRPMK